MTSGKKDTDIEGLMLGSKYTTKEAGNDLVKFLNNISKEETSIGEFRQEQASNKKTLIVSGHMMESGASPISIITSIANSSIDASGKFSNFMGETPQQILKEYMESIGTPHEQYLREMEQFKKINSNKVLPVPFKTETECEVRHKDISGSHRNTGTVIQAIRWAVDKESGKLVGSIICDVKSTEDGKNRIKTLLRDYGKEWIVPKIESGIKAAEVNYKLIVMNDIGFILPIQVSDGTTTLAIDGFHMYSNTGNNNIIIGTWKNGVLVEDEKSMSKVSKTKAYKYIKTSMTFIGRHSRFIIPYGLADPCSIDLR